MEKQLDITSLDEGVVPTLAVTGSPVQVRVNYEDIDAGISLMAEKFSRVEFTERNIETVKVVKSWAVSYRRRLEEQIKDARDRLFRLPDAAFKVRAQELLDRVADIEAQADEVLTSREEARKLEVRELLDIYTMELQESYRLREKFLALVIYKKEYYNKTAPKGFPSVDKFLKTDLEEQFKVLKKAQAAYDGYVRLIDEACDDPRINRKLYISMLENKDVAEVLDLLKEEKQRLATIAAPDTPDMPETTDAAEEVLRGIDLGTDFPTRTKTIALEITYPCDMGDALTEIFKRLSAKGVTTKPVREAVAC